MTESKYVKNVTFTVLIIAVTIGLGTLPNVGNVFAALSGSDTGQNAHPTLGIDFRGQRLIDDGLKINFHTFAVDSFSQIIPTQTVQVNQPIDITLHYRIQGGPSHLAHTGLTILNGAESEEIRWNQNFKGVQTVYVSNQEFFKNVVVTLTEDVNNPNNAFLNFKFQITENTYTSTIKVVSWSSDLRSSTNYFQNALQVGESPDMAMKSSPVIKTKAGHFIPPLKQISAGVLKDNVQCNTGKELLFKSNGKPACVNSSSVAKLVELGWIKK